MKVASYLTAAVAIAAGLALSTGAQAQDGALTSAKDLYFSGTIGGGVMVFSGSSNVASTYYGVDASAEVCRANGSGWDLCGGASLFQSLGDASKTTTTGTVSVTTETDVTAIGGFVKARKQVEQFGIAPYAGFRRFLTESTVTGLGAVTKIDDNANGAFGGVELDYALREEKVFLSLKAEVGRTFGAQTNRTTFLFAPGVKVKF